MGKSTISMAMFNSFLYVHQAGYPFRFRLQRPQRPQRPQLQERPQLQGPPRQMAQDCRGAQHGAKGAEDRVRPSRPTKPAS